MEYVDGDALSTLHKEAHEPRRAHPARGASCA